MGRDGLSAAVPRTWGWIGLRVALEVPPPEDVGVLVRGTDDCLVPLSYSLLHLAGVVVAQLQVIAGVGGLVHGRQSSGSESPS